MKPYRAQPYTSTTSGAGDVTVHDDVADVCARAGRGGLRTGARASACPCAASSDRRAAGGRRVTGGRRVWMAWLCDSRLHACPAATWRAARTARTAQRQRVHSLAVPANVRNSECDTRGAHERIEGCARRRHHSRRISHRTRCMRARVCRDLAARAFPAPRRARTWLAQPPPSLHAH